MKKPIETAKKAADLTVIQHPVPIYKQLAGDQANDAQRKYFPAQKEGTCWYYAMARIRQHYGKAYDQKAKERVVERTMSAYRKALTRCDVLEKVYKSLEADSELQSDPQAIEQTIVLFNLAKRKPNHNPLIPVMLETLQAFKKREDDKTLSQYLSEQLEQLPQQRIDCAIKALRSIIPGELQQNYVIGSVLSDEDKGRMKYFGISPSQTLRTLPLGQQAVLFKCALMQAAKSAWRVEHTDWKPDQGIDGLMKALRDKGPMMVAGFYGRSFYKSPPKLSSGTYEGRRLFFWQKGDYVGVKAQDNVGHAIVVVGAEKLDNGNGIVYYVDPNEPSENQSVTKISYGRLVGAIFNIRFDKEPEEGPFGYVSADFNPGH